MNQPSCIVCGRTDQLLVDQAHRNFVCGEHVYNVRTEFGYGLTRSSFQPYDTEVDVKPQTPVEQWARVNTAKLKADREAQFIKSGGLKKAMAAKDAQGAIKEGKEFARLFKALVQGKETVDFEVISDFAQYYAQNVIGYTDADRANGWTRGFIAGWTKAEIRSASGVDLSSVDPVELAYELLKRNQPPMLESRNGEQE